MQEDDREEGYDSSADGVAHGRDARHVSSHPPATGADPTVAQARAYLEDLPRRPRSAIGAVSRSALPSGTSSIASKQDHRRRGKSRSPDDHAQQPSRIEDAADERKARDLGDPVGRHVGGNVLHDRGQEAQRNEETTKEGEDRESWADGLHTFSDGSR